MKRFVAKGCRRSGGRQREIHHVPASFTPAQFSQPSTHRTSDRDKRELMAQARRAGWKGKTYRKAKRFERMLERIAMVYRRVAGEPTLAPKPVVVRDKTIRGPRWKSTYVAYHDRPNRGAAFFDARRIERAAEKRRRKACQ